MSSLENYKLYPLKHIRRAAAQPRLIQRLFPLFFLFDLNKCPLSYPRFTSPVCLFCCFIHVWFQSPFTAALLTSPFLTASLSLHPSLLPLCHHSSFQMLLCYLPKNVMGVGGLSDRKGCCERGDERQKDEGLDRVRQGCIMTQRQSV